MHFEAPRLLVVQQRFVRQAGQHWQAGAGNLRGGDATEAAAKDGKFAHRLSLLNREQFPGLVEDSPQTPVTFRHILQGRRQKIQVLFDLAGNFLARQHPYPGGR